MVLLEAKKISKKFSYPINLEVLKEINLKVSPGESVAIVGRSGEGKSTLLHILGTLDEPTSGQLFILGQEVNAANLATIRNQNVAFIFQSFQLLEDYSALENVLMPAMIAGEEISKGSPFYEKGLNLLKRVGLEQRAHFSAKLLSGGEKQRVAIARAFLNDPDILFADEPSGNLDRETAKEVHQYLLDYVQENNKALVVVTHDLELASLCSTRYCLSSYTLT